MSLKTRKMQKIAPHFVHYSKIGDRVTNFEDKVCFGNNVSLGAMSFKFNEDVFMDDLTFELEVAIADKERWARVRYLSVMNLRLRVNGEVVAYAESSRVELGYYEDYHYTSVVNVVKKISFEDEHFVVPHGNAIFEIEGDLEAAWNHFEGSTINFVLVDAEDAEGLSSGEDYARDGLFSKAVPFLGVTVASR